ncbi:antitoxin VapB family protein [Natronomonas gomsonensis]|jgi:predicted CopG family antitoxin|uniref:antitoxin VapB family protein n=1 Tax=Natronomonas gomsonensis TaxID=1046043 RepID=UPI0020CA956E|nr:antitoxin VapB family protein [Natronomonas gomsonensis]MCY4732635.1 antitoxin VapB family protein [Natronomonas gomsonensis]
MGTKTIGLRDEVYAQLKARKREDESFSDLVTRLLEEAAVDWRDSFGTLSEAEADELEALADRSREQMSTGMADRQQEALEALAGDDDETA